VAVADEAAVPRLQHALRAAAGQAGAGQAGAGQAGGGTRQLPKILAGPDAVAEVAAWPCDVVLNAVTGAQGLAATLAALDAGRVLALANKESLIMGGPLVAGRASPGQLVPVDSEHSAIAQCLRGGRADEVSRLVLTASGGPFLHRSRSELAQVTPAQALAHPTWNMGPVITVNCATLVNKGLELIEAQLLFGIGFDRIEVVVHRQSVVHSMVEFCDGSTIAQASPPDMRIPIALALGWPERVAAAASPVDWTVPHAWTFEPLDEAAFPAVALARAAGTAGGCAPAVYNAANEECVAAFLAGRVPFAGIVDTVAQVVSEHDGSGRGAMNLADVLAADSWARDRARELTGSRVR
jgi:1-deoxy-D-xylulose-5-phosphate reductoisomerase